MLNQTAAGPAKRGGDETNIRSGLSKNRPTKKEEIRKLQ
jgi:hypothetical protein